MMTSPGTDGPIAVGIDGSKHALRAVVWAAAEAVVRGVAVRLIYVVDAESKNQDREYAFAEQALHEAWMAAESTGEPVKLESVILSGDPVEQLVKASSEAQMVCVGSRGIGDSTGGGHGSTASALAEAAFAPVAIIRRRQSQRPLPGDRWIVAALEDSPATSAVLEAALDEASLRHAPVLALIRSHRGADNHENVEATLKNYLAETQDDNADIQMCTLPVSDHISTVLAQSAAIDQLVVVDSSDPTFVAEVVGPEARKLLRHTNCSVLVLRGRTGE